MNAKRKVGILLMVIGAVLVVSALALVIYNWNENRRAEKICSEIISELDACMASSEKMYTTTRVTAETMTESMSVTEPDTVGEGEIPKEQSVWEHYLQQRDLFEEWISIDGNWYSGILTIPDLDLRLPILGEYVYEDLRYTPCRYLGSYLTDNMIVAGHNYDAHFGRLHLLEPGDTLEFTAFDGSVYTYEVMQVEQLPEYALEDLTDMTNDWDLTLFTCTLSGAGRVTVRCERI